MITQAIVSIQLENIPS